MVPNRYGQRSLSRRFQRGQALIYGLFVLVAGLASLFFMFNTGQLAAEKTKLVNTADAVAYSAGIMHARAMNFDAYTNRALVANEVMLAQLVSMASWSEYTATHAENVPPLNCLSYYAVPIMLGLVTYEAACAAISYPAVASAVKTANDGLQQAASAMAVGTEAAKVLLTASQAAMLDGMHSARGELLQQVADANYDGDGKAHVDSSPILDDFFLFQGAPIIEKYTGNRRARLRDVAVEAAYRDQFVKERRWTSSSPWPCIVAPGADFKRRGGTEMIGLDEWKAMDTSSIHPWHYRFGVTGSGCRRDAEMPLGYAARAAASGNQDDNDASYGGASDNPVARSMASTVNWRYTGIPNFFELRQAALDYGPDNADTGKRELRVVFSIRVTRAKDQTRTMEGASGIKPVGRLDGFRSRMAGDVMAAIGTSEVFFSRPDRQGAPDELASLFNPFWQVRLRTTPAATVAIAQGLGGPR